MFTGIVKDKGIVVKRWDQKRVLALNILTKLPAKYFKTGSSIMVDGVCLTVELYKAKTFSVSVVNETLAKSNFGRLKVGSIVNLEPAITPSDLLSGHIVTGHVDAVATVIKTGDDFRVAVPTDYAKYFPAKSSIFLNGVSLTVKSRKENSVCIALIPVTLKKTNLSYLKVGDSVNFEIDILARYIESLIK